MGISKANPMRRVSIDPLNHQQQQRSEVARGSKVVVFGHADADGHLAVEQTRHNLSKEGVTRVTTIVSQQTRNYRFWEKAFCEHDFIKYDAVIVVDIAFYFKEPRSSLNAVLNTVDAFPGTSFIIIDHHPLQRPVKPRPNLELVEVSSPYDCCFGPPSNELMVLAEICDGDQSSVAAMLSAKSKARALGVRRAAADIDGVAGKQLLQLLRRRDWAFFEDLAKEPTGSHLTVRGRRHPNSGRSPLLALAISGL